MSKEQQRAIDSWFDSNEGKSCSNFETLSAGKFLKNRLWKAFIAGMSAGETIAKGNIIGKFLQIINSA